MENKVKRGIRPCNGRSIAICVITFLLTVVLLSLAITANDNTFKFLFVILDIAWIILGVCCWLYIHMDIILQFILMRKVSVKNASAKL